MLPHLTFIVLTNAEILFGYLLCIYKRKKGKN